MLGIPDLEGVDLQALFPSRQPMELEVGAGRGDFLLSYGAAAPGVNLIGVERKLIVLRRAANKQKVARLQNVRFVKAEIMYLLENYFGPSTLRAVHVYFPDPWPKKRHAKRRFFQPRALEQVRRVVEPGGFFHVRTDHERYFADILALMAQTPGFTPVPVPADLLEHRTGFEKRYLSHGMPIYRASFKLD